MKLHENSRMITFDIKDLCVNMPIGETLNVTKTLLSKHNDEHVTKQMLTLLHTILQQKYFAFQNIFQPDNGIAMGSPSLASLQKYFYNPSRTHISNNRWMRGASYSTRAMLMIFSFTTQTRPHPKKSTTT
jgi:hypothetical protein